MAQRRAGTARWAMAHINVTNRQRDVYVPPIPALFKSTSEFGRAIGWGRGEAAALKRASELTREQLQLIEVTVEIAAAWAVRYASEYEYNPANGSAKGRAVMMIKAAELLRDQS